MATDPQLFPLTAHLKVGDRVHYKQMGRSDQVSMNGCGEGDGVIELIWLGIEETVEIRRDDGHVVRCFPALDELVFSPEGLAKFRS